MKFYETKWFTWVTLICFPPVGIFLLWKYKHFSQGISVLLSIFFGFVFIAVFGSNTDTTKNVKNQKSTISAEVPKKSESIVETKKNDTLKPTSKPTPIATQKATTPPEPIVLGNGNFVAGEDFPEGEYDIVWVSGYGNVFSSTSVFQGGINSIMGEGMNGQKEYKNIKLPKNTKLTIDSVKIKLVPK